MTLPSGTSPRRRIEHRRKQATQSPQIHTHMQIHTHAHTSIASTNCFHSARYSGEGHDYDHQYLRELSETPFDPCVGTLLQGVTHMPNQGSTHLMPASTPLLSKNLLGYIRPPSNRIHNSQHMKQTTYFPPHQTPAPSSMISETKTVTFEGRLHTYCLYSPGAFIAHHVAQRPFYKGAS